MSFTFGAFNTATTDGITATLTEWPAPGVRSETVDILNGAWWGRTGFDPLTITFDLLVRSATPESVLALRDTLIAGCPLDSLQPLTVEAGDGWTWRATPASLPTFTRGLWVSGVECQLRGQISFLVPDGVAHASPDEIATGTTSATITRAKGNLPSLPKITIEGTFSSVVVTIGGQPVTVTATVTAGRQLILDFQAMTFGVWSGTTKVAHAALSDWTPRTLPLGSTTVSTSGGSVSSVTVAANSRRL